MEKLGSILEAIDFDIERDVDTPEEKKKFKYVPNKQSKVKNKIRSKIQKKSRAVNRKK